jgi:hypothetical protein
VERERDGLRVKVRDLLSFHQQHAGGECPASKQRDCAACVRAATVHVPPLSGARPTAAARPGTCVYALYPTTTLGCNR